MILRRRRTWADSKASPWVAERLFEGQPWTLVNGGVNPQKPFTARSDVRPDKPKYAVSLTRQCFFRIDGIGVPRGTQNREIRSAGLPSASAKEDKITLPNLCPTWDIVSGVRGSPNLYVSEFMKWGTKAIGRESRSQCLSFLSLSPCLQGRSSSVATRRSTRRACACPGVKATRLPSHHRSAVIWNMSKLQRAARPLRPAIPGLTCWRQKNSQKARLTLPGTLVDTAAV